MSGDCLVFGDDDFHDMGPDSRVCSGRHNTVDEAIAAAKQIVDEDVESAWQTGMSAADLYSSDLAFGWDSFVVAQEGAPPVRFRARDWAKERCQQTEDADTGFGRFLDSVRVK